MGDDRLRRLQRAWIESQDPEDEGRYLLARVRAGSLSDHGLRVAAWVGLEGARCALPDAVPPSGDDPRGALEAWSDGLVALIRDHREASWRLLHAEGERLLQLLEQPPDWQPLARLILIEGPTPGTTTPIESAVFHGDEAGAPTSPEAALLTIEAVDGAWRLRGRPAQVVLNGTALGSTPALLQHGDLIYVRETLFIFDAEPVWDTDRPRERALARAWLDDLATSIGPGAPRRATEPPFRPVRGGLATSWLTHHLLLLHAAIVAGQPASLEEWPADGRALGVDVRAWSAAIRASAREALGPWALGVEDPLRARARRALDALELASPCPMAWDDLTPRPGQPHVRDCSECQLQVYDVNALPRAEAQALIEQSGRVCVRLYRRGDGRVSNQDCPDSWREGPGGQMEELLGRIV